MTTATTAGPWHRDQYGSLLDSTGERVQFRGVSVCCAGSHVAEAEANTDLIASAPELLAALTALYHGMDSCVDLTPEVMRAASAAIAKATGAAA